jgi:hypothetical protein
LTKHIFIIAALLASLFIVACNEEEEELTPGIPEVSIEKKNEPVQITSFTPPPPQTVISIEKAKQYVDASAGLVLLGAKWSEEIEKAADQEKIKILNAYNLAREQVCAKVGLTGLAEYDWLTNVALKNPQNEIAFKEAGLRIK